MQQNLSSQAFSYTSLRDEEEFAGKNHAEHAFKYAPTIRINISWQQAEKMPYFYNWDAVVAGLKIAKEHNAQPVWDLCYAGFPDTITPVQPSFGRRFTAFCQSFVRYCKYNEPNAVLTVAPMDESMFFGSAAFLDTNPQLRDVVKDACDKAIAAMKEEDPNICVLTNHSVADIISLLGKTRLSEAALAIAS